ncbi:hypothetical protein EOL96_04610 [Candidatus Saccharibacteria bacterium]|nr:hypothetical protein [Candidatus Saccharibacteria bacterium]
MVKVLLQFIVSGAIVVAATYLAPRVGQKWAGLLVAAPLLTLLTFVFLSLNSPETNLKDYLAAALVYMVPAAIFIGSLFVLADKLHFIPNILVSFAIYALCVFLIHVIR